MLTKNSAAPAFTLPDQNGNMHSLSDYAGKWLLVYFYPKDDTPGCTIEACSIRDNFADFTKAGIEVLGVSKDDVASHKKFADKFSLPFTLLADESGKMVEAYGAWGERTRSTGEKVMSIMRISYLIDPQGKVAKVYPNVQPEQHAAEILSDHAMLK